MVYKGIRGLLLFILILAVTACSTGNKQEQLANGDTLETTASIHDTPIFLEHADGELKNVYQLALTHKDIMQKIPVYDGSSYKNIFEAFLYKVNPDGSIVWNSHGSNSGKAIAVATDVIAMSEEGKSLKEIEKAINKKYAGQYGADSPRLHYNQ
ncbi:PCYCGC motif-containing (lipo)protein [Aneurinibacillus terranovensis]|uniref:PCYCGC motif-containing (lipo)protein n=1 Tax=Aneurinibacillus terranovensis TaxID=278991 RepID=UPI0004133CF4|nr:PCYCGC motif-containing (lipo)protein [Aneurinibacillus terranovensis]